MGYIYIKDISVRHIAKSFSRHSLALYKKVLLLLFLFSFIAIQVEATHLRAGQITVRQIGPRKFIIKIEVWTNTRNTTVLFGGDQDILDFGDKATMLVPEQQNQAGKPGRPPLPQDVAYASFEVTHDYPAPGVYTISYREPNRNEGVLNMDGSVNTTFYLETQIVIDPFYGQNDSPYLEVDPIDRACPGVAFTHNPGAYDPNPGDSISYSMEVPFSDRRTQVINYKSPDDARLYTSVDYNTISENGTPPTFNINQVTGTITWDAPGNIGEYNIAFHVIEWRKINGEWRRLGYVRRDMQILVEDCDNERPELEIPPDTCVIAGTVLKVPIIGTDEDGDQVKIEAFSPIFEPPYQPPATIVPKPGPNDFRPVPAVTEFTWQTQCKDVKSQPYTVVFKITDNPDLGPQLATFETWNITVVGPPPVWQNYTKNDAKRHVTVNWQPYTCPNAELMQVWRKVDGVDFEPTVCETGMPEYLGYQLVGTVPVGSNTFTDTNSGKGLATGARYCYRLVAVFPAATGSESLVSQDICIEPFDITTPVITNVSVLETRENAGKIEVKWIPPIEHPTYPAAYTYRIYRSIGPTRGTDSTLVGTTTDLSFIDNSNELNTEGIQYSYSVAAFLNGETIGVSAVASSVRLETQSRLRRIDLSWGAVVPWSNVVPGDEYMHVIYRGENGATDISQMQKIDSVAVTETGFSYVDEGQWNNTPLEEKVYCYLVVTRGSYGNTKIHTTPLLNRSQIICAEPGDDVPPCKPTPPTLATARDCALEVTDQSTCNVNQFENVLVWPRSKDDCDRDIAFYRIYYSNTPNGEYQFLAETRDTTYTDKLQTSFARCYKIAAVDRSGNISDRSEAQCFENCPYYELPNVFTPNGDECNDRFYAYGYKFNTGETGGQECPVSLDNVTKCARFVEKVVFKVYNRWGREVYSYTGESTDDNNGIYIGWDGLSSDGQQLSTGVYYYVAEVTFIAIDPSIKFKTLKGWIHLLRDQGN